MVLSDSTELDFGLWKAYCNGKEAQAMMINDKMVGYTQFHETTNTNSYMLYILAHPSSGVVSPEQAQCWRLFPHGL